MLNVLSFFSPFNLLISVGRKNATSRTASTNIIPFAYLFFSDSEKHNLYVRAQILPAEKRSISRCLLYSTLFISFTADNSLCPSSINIGRPRIAVFSSLLIAALNI